MSDVIIWSVFIKFRSQDSLRKNGSRTNVAQQSYTTSSSLKNSEKSGDPSGDKKSGTAKSEEEEIKDIHERMHWQEPDPIFEKFRREWKDDLPNINNTKEDDFRQDFRSSFDSDRDPLESPTVSATENRIKFSQVRLQTNHY
jgi:hypothetical protein